jgi:hypothetical protein
MLGDCRSPPNPEKQKQMRKEFRDKRSKSKSNAPTNNSNNGGRTQSNNNPSGGGATNGSRSNNSNTRDRNDTNQSSKWCPPAPHENNRRHISKNGQCVPHQWNARIHRWFPVANVAESRPVSNPPSTVTEDASRSSNSSIASQQRVNIANMQQQMNNAFANMLQNARN